MVQLFTNFAESTLQQSVDSDDLTFFIDETEADNFPSPTGGDFFVATVYDQRNGTAPEIIQCTGRTGGALTVVRAQESTAAQAWPSGSRLHLSVTASVIESILNQVAVQTTWTGTATGTAAYTLNVTGALPIPTNGDEVVFTIPATNTGNATLVIDNSISTVGPFPILNTDGTQLDQGDFAEDFLAVLRWSSADGAWRVASLVSAQLAATALNDGPLTSVNRIVGGMFGQWSASSFSSPASLTETAENVFVVHDGTIGTFTVSRQSFTLGQTDVEGDPLYFLRWDHTVAGSGSTVRKLRMPHRMKNAAAWRNGDQVTLSFYAKADSNRDVTAQLVQHFGTGGAPSADVTAGSQLFGLSVNWQRFTLTINVPSIAGKTFGSNLDHELRLEFLLPLNTTMTIDFAQVQVEPGPRQSLPWGEFPISLQQGGTGFRANTTAELGTKLGVVLIANLLSAILAIDGAGSGIDADLLDGLSSASYVQTSGAQSIAGVKTFTTGSVWDVAAGGAVTRWSRTAGNGMSLFMQSGTAGAGQRWSFSLDNIAESGANAGSNWSLAAYDDAGIFIANRIAVNRATGAVTYGGVQLGPAGAAAGPSWSFSGDTNTGMFSSAADVIGFSAGGTERVTISTTALSATVPTRLADGAGGTPSYSFTSDTDTGMYLSGPNSVAISAGGSGRLFISTTAVSSTLPFRAPDGNSGAPGLTFDSDTDNGFFRKGANNIGITGGGTEIAQWDSVGLALSDIGPTSTLAAGFRGTPENTQNAAYGILLTDAGKTIYHDEINTRTWTIPANASVAFPIGTVIILDNTGNGGGAPGAITLAITSDTLRRGDGVAGTGSRTVPSNAVAAIRKTKSTEWVITGTFT